MIVFIKVLEDLARELCEVCPDLLIEELKGQFFEQLENLGVDLEIVLLCYFKGAQSWGTLQVPHQHFDVVVLGELLRRDVVHADIWPLTRRDLTSCVRVHVWVVPAGDPPGSPFGVELVLPHLELVVEVVVPQRGRRMERPAHIVVKHWTDEAVPNGGLGLCGLSHDHSAERLTDEVFWILGRLCVNLESSVPQADVHIAAHGIVVRSRLIKRQFEQVTKVPNNPELFFGCLVLIGYNPEDSRLAALAPFVCDATRVDRFGQQDVPA